MITIMGWETLMFLTSFDCSIAWSVSFEIENGGGHSFFGFLDQLGLETGVFIGLSLLFYIWAFSLQSAGGVIAYMTQAEAVADQQNAFDMSMDEHLESMSSSRPQMDRPMQSEDVMELIRSRMQQNKR